MRGDGTLRLGIVRGRATELIGPPTGYGRYGWVVDTDLSLADPFRVAASFVRGTGAEQDVEFSRWGDPLQPADGTWVTWRRQTERLGFGSFAVPAAPPYTVRIDWRAPATRFRVRAASGAVLLDQTVATARAGRHVSPRISHWLYCGDGTRTSPHTTASAHPPLVVRSFSFHR